MADVDITVSRQAAVINIGGISSSSAADVSVTDSGNLYGLGTPITVQQLADQVASLIALKAGGTVDNFTAIRYTATPVELSVTASGPGFAVNWDLADGAFAYVTLDNDAGLTITGSASFITLIVLQDGTGGHTLTLQPPALNVITDNVTTGANSKTVYNLVYDPFNGNWLGTGLTVVA